MFSSHYFHHTLKRELSELYITTVIRAFAGSMLLIFTPLYFFNLGFSIVEILLFAAISYAVFALSSITLGAHTVVHFGHERSIALSVPLLLAYNYLLFSLSSTPAYFFLAAVVLGIHNGVYWVAYHSEFAHAQSRGNVGDEIGFSKILIGLAGVVAPAIAGFIITSSGFGAVLITSSIIMVLGLIPILKTPEIWKSGTVSSYAILRMFTDPRYSKDVVGHMASGEDVIASFIWPLFLFFIIPSYQDIGLLTTFATLFTFLLFLWVGKQSNYTNHTRPLISRIGGLITFSWLARLLALTPFSALITDTLYKISAHTLSIPLTALVYQKEKTKEIIEYTAFWMASLSFGKMITALLAALVVYYTHNLVYTFILAALLSLLYFVWSDAITKKFIVTT